MQNPLRYAFKNLRNRAKQRGHAFQLTFQQYTNFADETGYALLKGKHNKSLTIDRIDAKKGYHIDNIRCVRMITNARLAYTKMPGWMINEMLAAEAESIANEVADLKTQS